MLFNTTSVQEMIDGLDTGSKQRLNGYIHSLSKDKYSTNFDKRLFSELVAYALNPDEVARVVALCKKSKYTQCWYRYSMMEQQIDRFSQRNHPWFGWNKNYRRAEEALIAKYKSLNCRMLHYRCDEDIIDVIPKMSSHTGWEFIPSGIQHKGDNLEKIFDRYVIEEKQALSQGHFQKPILIGYRTQTPPPFDTSSGEYLTEWKASEKCKSRVVSMVDMFQNIASARFGKPLQDAMGSVLSYAGGKTDERINDIIQVLRHQYPYWVSLDYSQYDQSLSDWIIESTFRIMRAAFAYDPNFDEDLWQVVKRSTIMKIFIDGKGKLRVSSKGEPSGERLTNIVDSIANELIQTTYQYSLGKSDDEFQFIIMGDDNLIFTKYKLDVDKIASYVTKNFGVICNAAKCDAGSREDHPSFLSRSWTPMGAWRHPNVIISKMLHPERFRDYKKTGLDPALIIYAYILSFPVGMRQFIDVERFKHDHANLIKTASKEDLVHASGSLRYRIEYGLI